MPAAPSPEPPTTRPFTRQLAAILQRRLTERESLVESIESPAVAERRAAALAANGSGNGSGHAVPAEQEADPAHGDGAGDATDGDLTPFLPPDFHRLSTTELA